MAATALWTNDFGRTTGDVADGVAITVANSTDGTADRAALSGVTAGLGTFQSDPTFFGARHLRVAQPGATPANFSKNGLTPAADFCWGWGFELSALPSATFNAFRAHSDSGGATKLIDLNITTTGRLQLNDTAGVTSTGEVIAPGDKYWLSGRYNSTTLIAETSIYKKGELTPWITVSKSCLASSMASFRFGVSTASANVNAKFGQMFIGYGDYATRRDIAVPAKPWRVAVGDVWKPAYAMVAAGGVWKNATSNLLAP